MCFIEVLWRYLTYSIAEIVVLSGFGLVVLGILWIISKIQGKDLL